MGELVEQHKQTPAVPTDSTPDSLLATAVANGASVEQMERLIALKERWEAGEARKAYNEAISAFRAKCPSIEKTRSGHNTKYAGLAETVQQIQPYMAEFGLSHSWRTGQTESGLISVTCVITHRQGHQEETTLSAAADTTGSKNSIQAIGSTVAYLERYTLFAALGLASKEMDDDGQSANRSPDCIDDSQIKQLQDAAVVAGVDDAYVCKKGNVKRLGEIKKIRFNSAINHLKKLAMEGSVNE